MLHVRAILFLSIQSNQLVQGTYNSHYEATEPDPYIVDLNAELVQCDEFMAIYLPVKERKCVQCLPVESFLLSSRYAFAGLGYLLEHMLIANARHLWRPTGFGIKKILRNILALQQVVKTLTDDLQEAEFEHAKEYFSYFFVTPQVRSCVLSCRPVVHNIQEMLDHVRENQTFTFEDYQTMLNLQCNIDQGETADRNYSTHLLDLQCLVMESMTES